MGRQIVFLLAATALFCISLPAIASQTTEVPPAKEEDLVQKYEAADARFFKAEDFFLKQDYLNARSALAECLKLMPEHSEAHYMLAEINLREGYLTRALNHVVKAEAYYDFAVKIRDQQQQRLLLELQRMRDEQDAILTELGRVLNHTSDPSSRQSLESRILLAQKIKTSIEDRLLSPRTPSGDGPADYHLFHGEILLALKRYSEAETQFRITIRLAPTDPDAYERLAGMLLVTEHAQIAMDVIDEAESKGVVVDEKLKRDVLKALGK